MKKITRAAIMGELVDKFALQEFEKEDFLFGEFVVPTYDIGPHVKQWKSIEKRTAVTANGVMTITTMPPTERWSVRRIDVMHETGANYDVDQVFFYHTATEHQYLFYDTVAPITSGTVKIFALPQDVVMDTNGLNQIRLNISNFVAGGYISVNIYREVETLL